ncbi:glutamate--tRNA ligase [bacterium]|jgi:glutamyl-tRNA synthetase|nr:glutamate--tRNA ligase [bacterium]
MRVRFAPSPTGNLHIGSVRTALFNWVYAHKIKGKVVLRIEDTDLKRSEPQFETNILEGLKWLGLDMDEGPESPGDTGPYRQSERMETSFYKSYVDQLLTDGKAYYCFETAEELEAEKEAAELSGVAYQYSGKALSLSPEEIKSKLDLGTSYTVRFHIPENQKVTVPDMIRGDVVFDSDLLSDFIIQKSDGSPTYNFAVVVDDITMAISHVIRGEDHLSNTPRQILLYEALNAKVPQFAHLPIILGPDRSKLSKRHGAKSVTEYREEGYLADTLINYLSLLGWAPPEGREILTRTELVDLFDIGRVSKSGAVFDVTKLKWMNGMYIRRLSEEALLEAVTPFISEDLQSKLVKYSDSQRQAMVVAVRDNLELLSDVNAYLEVFSLSFEAYCTKIAALSFSESDIKVQQLAYDAIDSSSDLDSQFVGTLLDDIIEQTGLGKGKVFKPLRLATSGFGSGPALGDYIPILGKDVVLERLRHGLSKGAN